MLSYHTSALASTGFLALPFRTADLSGSINWNDPVSSTGIMSFYDHDVPPAYTRNHQIVLYDGTILTESLDRNHPPDCTPQGTACGYYYPAKGKYVFYDGHDGIDFKLALGKDVLAAAAGTASFEVNNCGFGMTVRIDHNNGYTTLYGHLSEISVTQGKVVAAGDVIGRSGSTVGTCGTSTAAHLHFGVYHSGTVVDPFGFYCINWLWTTAPGFCTPSNGIPGDLNGDGIVNAVDYAIFFDHYGENGPGNIADLNGDGRVNAVDYAIFFDHFGQTVSGARSQVGATAPQRPPTAPSLVGAAATSTSFKLTHVWLPSNNSQATVTVSGVGLDPITWGVQLSVQHPSNFTVTSPRCTGIFAGGDVLGPAQISSTNTLIACGLEGNPVPAMTGDVMSFVLTRQGAGDGRVTLLSGQTFYGVGGPGARTSGSPGTLNTLSTLPGDLNGDCLVNIFDLSILLSNYGTTNAIADINNDGRVDIFDLSILLSKYAQGC
jgi:murein DD-endopeptidase MepM/ murein hydrolase activator NlpD